MEISLSKKRIFYARHPDEVLVKGAMRQVEAQEQGIDVKVSSQIVPMTGGAGTVTVSNARLAKKFILGITARIVTELAGTGLTTFSIGDGTDADRYGAAIPKTAGTTVDFDDATADPREWLAAAGNIVFTAAAGQFDSGEVRLDIHYIELAAPTS